MIQHENMDTKANIYSLEDNANNKKARYFSVRVWKHLNMECHYWEKIVDFSTLEGTLYTSHKPFTDRKKTKCDAELLYRLGECTPYYIW